jgi:hypothetical protein|tara:strand:- start:277 stop:525 length:249 start_codon:yes stop_codon:yes gene_type:complete
MKESKLLEMQNKIDAMTRVLQQLINEVGQLRDLSIGTLETLKKMPAYKKALDSLRKDIIEKSKKEKKFETVEELEKHKAKNK